MKKINLLILLCLFAASQAFAQQPQSFAEYWFGVKPQTGVQKSTKTTVRKAPAKTKQRATKASGVITLDLSQPTNPESFTLDNHGVWTETYNDVDYPFMKFNESTFMLSHLVGGEGSSYDGAVWDGFTYSKNADHTDHSPDWVANQWGNMAGGGIKTDAQGNVMTDGDGTVLADPDVPYLLGFWSSFMEGAYDYPILTAAFDDVYQAKGVYVNNSPWAYFSNQNGDGVSRALDQDGDYFKLIIHGLDENWEDNGKTVEYYLAKNEGGTLIQSPDWEWVDLSSLGEVGGIYFTMESTDNGDYGINTPTYFCMDKLQVEAIEEEPAYTYAITVPEDASVYVGAPEYSGYNYRPFTEKEDVGVLTIDGKKTFYYNVTGKHNYRVTMEGALTQLGVFTPSDTNTELEITEDQLISHSPKDTDRDVTSNNNYNVADVFLNINEKGHLRLSQGDIYQLVNLRTWTMVDNVVSNYFLEPDYHYTVINENGAADNSVVTVDGKGKLTAVGNGTAIVRVTYDAANAHYAAGGPFFGALWAENTGVFAVSVGAPASDITSGMIINNTLNTNAESKLAAAAIDAELDVFYYTQEKGGYDYTFTPVNVASVTLAQPAVGENMTTYSGFSTDNVTANGDGSYTVRLINGRNIVKMTSAGGAVEYQVLTAKEVNYTVSNLTNPEGKINPGDQISVKFNTLYHPCGKLAGIYNMSAGIQYNGIEAAFSPFGGAGQYTFASKAQEYKITIPENFEGDEYLLTGGVIKASGFGSPYGYHRSITLENGAGTNMTAQQRTAYFGALPDIHISMKGTNGIADVTAADISVYPNPFADYIVIESANSENATIYDLSGKAILTTGLKSGSNRINTFALPQGVYVLKTNECAVKIVK